MSKIIKDAKLFYVSTNGSAPKEVERYSSSGELSVNSQQAWAVEIATPFEEQFNDLMLSDKGLWIGRIGGSDFNFVKDYLRQQSEFPNYDDGGIRAYNGYFDFKNKPENINKFVYEYLESCKSMDSPIFVGGHDLSEAIIEREEDPAIHCFAGDFWNEKTYASYAFIESFMPFMRSFKTWGRNKKILVVSPLSKSVEFQTQESRLNKIHGEMYSFPECEFLTYNTPVSYNMAGTHFFDARGTENWREMSELMFDEIKELEFDVALLSCAAYAMPLGRRIKNELNKKSVYVGGALNLMFNIYGNRFADYPQYKAESSRKYRIEAIENKEVQNIPKHNLPWSESWNAYFGSP